MTTDEEWLAIAKCRTFGHAWEPWSPTAARAPVYGIREYVRCTRCYTERHRVFSPFTGEPEERPVYIYPITYKERDKMNRNTWRVEMHRKGLLIGTATRRTRRRA